MTKQQRDLINPNYGMVIHRSFVPLYADDHYAQFFGYQSGEDILALDIIFPLINPSQQAEVKENYEAIMSGKAKPQVRSFKHLDKQNNSYFILAIEQVVDWQGEPALQIAYVDISAFTKAEAKIRESEQRFRDLIEGSIQGMVIHRHFKPLMVNQAYASMHGFSSPEEIMAIPDIRVFFTDSDKDTPEQRAALIMSNQMPNPNQRFKNRRKDGSTLWVELVERKVNWHGQDAIQTTLVDVSTQVLMEKKLTQLAMTDSLTGLYNRRYLMEKTAQLFADQKRMGGELACILIDLDKFKQINDEYGHSAGDEVLKVFSNRCREYVSKPNFIGRYGGEEFMIVLPEGDYNQAHVLAESIRECSASQILETSYAAFTVTISAGVSVMQAEDNSFDQLIDRADKCLYKAKSIGRNQVVS